MDISPILHALAAFAVQVLVWLLSGDWLLGGAIGSVWFIAREHTQAEYHWIAKYGNNKRANMPWYGGFDIRVWDAGSIFDCLLPAIVCTIVWLV